MAFALVPAAFSGQRSDSPLRLSALDSEAEIFAPPSPHHKALFSLVPLNEPAHKILRHERNRRLVSVIKVRKTKVYGLDVGPHIGSEDRNTLAVIGRAGDIFVPDEDISRKQCSFEVNEESNAVLLEDRSRCREVRTFGNGAYDFEDGRVPRRDLVAPNVNCCIGFGGPGKNRYEFKLYWHEQREEDMSRSSDWIDDPVRARTLESRPEPVLGLMPLPDQVEERGPQIRWIKGEIIGAGTYGKVYEAIDIDSGNKLAVKHINTAKTKPYKIQREIYSLQRLSHPNIVEYIGSKQCSENEWAICMPRKEGSVEDLQNEGKLTREIVSDVFRDVLKALAVLAKNNIVHRDVKPGNILVSGGVYQLSDFGVANIATFARSYEGTMEFMAPEISSNHEGGQSCKADIWSLLITIIHLLHLTAWRAFPLETTDQRIAAVRAILKHNAGLSILSPMAEVDPEKRISAQELLNLHFSGTNDSSSSSSRHQQQPGLEGYGRDDATRASSSSAAGPSRPRSGPEHGVQKRGRGRSAPTRRQPIRGVRNLDSISWEPT